MANAEKVVEVVEAEIRLMEKTGGQPEHIQGLKDLVEAAKAAGDGEISDDLVRESALHPSQSRKLIEG